MTRLQGGSPISLAGAQEFCTIGCLAQWKQEPKKALIMTVSHGIVRQAAAPGDQIVSADDPNLVIGRLATWTTFPNSINADLALVWADPDKVSASIAGLGNPLGVNSSPNVNDTVQVFSSDGQGARTATIAALNQPVDVEVVGPDWRLETVTYLDQILCEPMFTEDGDSGAMVLDAQNRVIGMVVATRPVVQVGDDVVNQTVVTPIKALLSQFGGDLEILTQDPAGFSRP